jgi:hypothetical protein
VYILLYITNALWEIFYQYFYFLFYRDGFIDGEELNNLLSAVFSDGTESYSFNTDYKSELMQLLDQDKVWISLYNDNILLQLFPYYKVLPIKGHPAYQARCQMHRWDSTLL